MDSDSNRKDSLVLTPMKWQVYDWLDRPGGRHLLGWLATVFGTFRFRHPFRVFLEDGVWVHRYYADFYLALPRMYIPKQTVKTPWRFRPRNLSDWLPKPEDSVLKPGQTVFNIGAGTGGMTYMFSKFVGPTGNVLAVEAHPRTFLCLKKTCLYNQLANVMFENCAVLNSDSEVLIDDGQDYDANHIFTESGIRIAGKTIDSLVSAHGIEQIDFLYMNIEGAERLAIEGMQESVRNIRHVCIACHDFRAETEGKEAMRTKSLVVEFLSQHGFRTVTKQGCGAGAAEDFVFAENLTLSDARGRSFETLWPFSQLLARGGGEGKPSG